MYNLLEHAYLQTCTSGISGYTLDSFTPSGILAIQNGTLIKTIANTKYVALEAIFGNDFLCDEARIYTSATGISYICTKEFISNVVAADGSYNNSTGYGTPQMTSAADPEPFSAYSDYQGWTDVTTAMTSNTAPFPYKVFTTSNTASGYKAFDHSTLNYWKASEHLPQSISYDFGSQYKVENYRFRNVNSTTRNPPKSFGLYGSNLVSPTLTDESNWTQLHYYYDLPDYGANSYSPWFAVTSPGLYRHYRLKVTALQYPSVSMYVDINEIEFSTGVDTAWKAFDQTVTSSSDCWTSDRSPLVGSGVNIVFGCGPTGKVFNKYALQGANVADAADRASPIDWTLKAALLTIDVPDINNPSHWVTLDTRTGATPAAQSTWTSFYTLSNATAYKYYRLNITNRYGTASYTRIGNIKFVESSRFGTTAYSDWRCYTPTRQDSYYSKVFEPPIGLEGLRFFYANSTGNNVTVSGFEALSYNDDSIITMSGIIANSSLVPNYFRFSFDTTEPKILNIKNYMDGSATPFIQLQYTNVYDIDRNVLFSTDYSTNYYKDESLWKGLESGFVIPEEYDWWLGTLSGTQEVSRTLRLVDTVVSGYWSSPVLDTGNVPSIAYVYGTEGIYHNNNYRLYSPSIEIRASESPPAEALFLVITTNNTHKNLMYHHKRVFIDSNGQVINKVECNLSTETGNKLWRIADNTFAGTELRYYGSVSSRGTASFLCPGMTTCGDTDPVQEMLNYSKWYNLCSCTMESSTYWNNGVTVSGIKWGDEQSVVYTKTFPIEGSTAFFTASILTSTSQAEEDRTIMTLAFQDGTITKFVKPMITVLGNKLLGDDYFEIIADVANNGWWVYLGGDIGKIYKIDPGSFDTVRIFMSENPLAETGAQDDIYYGYLYSLNITNTLKHLIEIPNPLYSGFWAFTDESIYLYDEVYDYDEPNLVVKRTFTQGSINTDTFSEIHTGACDAEGNLWVIDITQARLMRINLQKCLNNDSLAIDYDNIIDGITGVLPHPSNGSAYVFITNELDHPNQDIVRMVNVGQSAGSRGKYMCEIPGFCSSTYRYGVHFTGIVFAGPIKTHTSDPFWGTTGLTWQQYFPGKTFMPRGRYKQFRISLQRSSSSSTSPILYRIRIPEPIELEPLDRLQERQLAIKTLFNRVTTYGTYDVKLLTWWGNKEFE